jgi:hypothetical protein
MQKDSDLQPAPQMVSDGEEKDWKSIIASYRERSIERMGKYSWITVLNQILLGLGLLAFALYMALPYLVEGWYIALASVIFLSGSYYGWYISRGTEINLSESGAAIFSYANLWKKFIPMLTVLFFLRFGLIYLDRKGIMEMAPIMRSLTFFIAGVFTARGITLLVNINQLKRNRPKPSASTTLRE